MPARRDDVLLVNLWASWCRPCIDELAQLSDSHERLRQAGIDVLALSVDGVVALAPGGPSGHGRRADVAADGVQNAAKIAASLTLRTGLANRQLVEQLTAAHHQVLYRQRDLPVPTSFLLIGRHRNADGGDAKPQWEVAMIYKGTVSPSGVMGDLQLLRQSRKAWVASATGLGGRNVARWFAPTPLRVAKAHLDGGYFDDARTTLEAFVASADAAAVSNLGRNGDDDHVAAWQMLASIAQHEHDEESLLRSLQAIVRLRPNDPRAANNLAWAMAQQAGGDRSVLARAARLAQFACDHAPAEELPSFLDTLAMVRARQGDATDAATIAERAAKLARQAGDATTLRRIEEHLHDFRRQMTPRESD